MGSAEAGEHVVDTMMGECGYDEEEEDDLGYYPDGVKRTLTDAQIAIFRHTEYQEMLSALTSRVFIYYPNFRTSGSNFFFRLRG